MSHTLTKDYIFKYADSLEIIQKCIDLPDSKKRGSKFNNISSPFTNDSTASFSVYEKNGEWRWKDWSSSENGNCFDLWQLTQMKNKSDVNFYEILKDVATSFNIQIPRSESNYKPNPKQKWEGSFIAFSKASIEFWQQAGVTAKVLDKYKIRQLLELEYYSDNKQKFNKWSFAGQIAFEYRIQEMRKMYRPKHTNTDGKEVSKVFMQRGEDIGLRWIFGLDQLPKHKVTSIIICAGEKDCITLNANGFYSVCFASEGTMPTVAQIKALKRRCHTLCVLFDNDKLSEEQIKKGQKQGAGQKFASKLSRRYDLLNLSLANVKGNQNDAFDFFKNVDNAKGLLDDYIIDEVHTFKELRRISVWEFNSHYMKYNKAEKRDEWIANFIIETEAYIEGTEDGTPAKRIFTLVKKGVKSKAFQAPAEVFLSADKFATFIQSYVGSGYIYKGSTTDLKEIQVLANFDLDQTAKNALLGQSETETEDFIFSNGVLKNGVFIKPDRNRIAAGYYLRSDLDLNFSYKDGSNWKLQRWFESISKMYGYENTFTGLAFIVNALIYDSIAVNQASRQVNISPILSFYGQKGSGKSYLAKCLLSLFAYDYQPLEKSTPKALAAFTRLMNNIPAIKDEVNHLTDYDVDIFKAIANLTGRTTKAFSNDDRINSNPPLRPLITCGQILLSDEALLSRAIICECEVLKKSSKFMKVSREFSTEKEKGFSTILVDLLQYRHAMITNFKTVYFELIEEINNILDSMNELDVNMRLVNNLAATFAPVLIAQRNGLKISIKELKQEHSIDHLKDKTDFEKTLLGFIISKLTNQKDMEQASDPVENFFNALPEMERVGKGMRTYIERGYDFDFDDDLIWLRSNCFQSYIQFCNDKGLKLFERARDIQNYLKKKEYFVGYNNKSIRSLGKQAKCYIVEKSALNNLDIVFRDSLNDDV